MSEETGEIVSSKGSDRDMRKGGGMSHLMPSAPTTDTDEIDTAEIDTDGIDTDGADAAPAGTDRTDLPPA